MGLIELFKCFHAKAVSDEFPPSARVLYLTLLGEFNKNFWEKELSYTERDLKMVTRLSKTAVHEAKEFLSKKHLIKTWNTKKGTVFTLLGDQVPTNERPTSDQQATTTGFISYANFKEKDNKTVNTSRTREPTASTAAVELSEEVQKAWFDVMAKKVDGYEYRKLLMWEREFGTKKLINSLYTARDHNKESRISFAFIQAILEGRKESGKSEFVSEYASLEF